MEYDVKKEARRQYLKYFRVWLIITAVMVAIGIGVTAVRLLSRGNAERGNYDAPSERVYDYADVLTDGEEDKLREYIAQMEPKLQADIVLVTVREPMESDGVSWETAMRDYSDDFFLENNYGYDKVHGNGVLLLDNWYEDQEGSWLCSCGNIYEEFGTSEINEVLDAVYYGLEDGTYAAYRDYITTTCDLMGAGSSAEVSAVMILGSLLLPAIVALIYALVHLNQKQAKDTTQANTYVAGGRPVMKVSRDDFIRKSVVKRRIQTSSSGGGSGSSGGRGGSHSRGGVSLGGGGRRR